VFNRAVLNRTGRMRRVLPVLPVVLLAGCGVAGTQFHPGVAAQVDDTTITTRHVDQLSHDSCRGLEELNKGGSSQPNSPTPLSTLTHQVTQALVDKAVAQRLADSYDVKTTSDYTSNLNQTRQQLTSLSEGDRDAIMEVIGAQAYTQDVLVQVGEIELKKQGKDDATAQDQFAEGQKVAAEWADHHDVDINPKYSLEYGTDGPVDTSLSYAVGANAKDGAGAQPSAGYVGSLPSDFVCFD
jgi:hypothetical protein